MTIKEKIPKVAKGYNRQWIRCIECGRIYYYDYVPYSCSTPIRFTDCGHSLGRENLGCAYITEKQAKYWLRKKAKCT
jgi:hypothetical protein